METIELGLELSSHSWADMNNPGNNIEDVDLLVDRILAIMLIRIIGVLSKRGETPNLPEFPDYSTSTICHTLIDYCTKHQQQVLQDSIDEIKEEKGDGLPSTEILIWPEAIQETVISQLYDYISQILEGYRGVSYHNRDHAYHVFMSAHKLLDMVLCEYDYSGTISCSPIRKPNRITYGLKSDPLTQLAFLFSALVHDVDHTGVSNRQLVLECDELAILYNDQSVAEQRSLAIAFSLLMKNCFGDLRTVIFTESGEYMKFRKLVIDIVLCTDIASPERVQIVKSKWKEAFGEKPKQQNILMMPPTKEEDDFSRASLRSASIGSQRRTTVLRNSGCKRIEEIEFSNNSQISTGHDRLENPSSLENVASNDNAEPPSRSDLAPQKSLTFAEVKKRNEWKTAPLAKEVKDQGSHNLVRSFFRHRGSITFGSRSGRIISKRSSAQSDEQHESINEFRAELEKIKQRKKKMSKMQSFRKSLRKFKPKRRKRKKKKNQDESLASVHETKEIENEGVKTAKSSVSNAIGKSIDEKTKEAKLLVANNEDKKEDFLLPEGLLENKLKTKKSSSGEMDKIKGLLNQYEDDLSVSSEYSNDSSVFVQAQGRRSSLGAVKVRTYNKSASMEDPALSTSEHKIRIKRTMMRRSSSHTDRSTLRRQSRRFTEPPNLLLDRKKFHFRLGIRRALDLSGNQIDPYKASTNESLEQDQDENDDFKVIVILEQLMKAADVAANMQGWETMVAWCKRLFFEQKKCFNDGRGPNPVVEWHENQIAFFESYTMPLACRVAETGVLELDHANLLVNGVRQNNIRWMIEGRLVLEKMKKEFDELDTTKKAEKEKMRKRSNTVI
jgi:hypothetical protein